jgi:hypothetical protein
MGSSGNYGLKDYGTVPAVGCCRHQLFACVSAGRCPRLSKLARDMERRGKEFFLDPAPLFLPE